MQTPRSLAQVSEFLPDHLFLAPPQRLVQNSLPPARFLGLSRATRRPPISATCVGAALALLKFPRLLRALCAHSHDCSPIGLHLSLFYTPQFAQLDPELSQDKDRFLYFSWIFLSPGMMLRTQRVLTMQLAPGSRASWETESQGHSDYVWGVCVQSPRLLAQSLPMFWVLPLAPSPSVIQHPTSVLLAPPATSS